MKRRYTLAPEAAHDLAAIWQYLRDNAGERIADRVEAEIIECFGLLSEQPGIGHWRQDLTDLPVKFFTVYSYLVVYLPESKPLRIVAVLHGHRDVASLLPGRA